MRYTVEKETHNEVHGGRMNELEKAVRQYIQALDALDECESDPDSDAVTFTDVIEFKLACAFRRMRELTEETNDE